MHEKAMDLLFQADVAKRNRDKTTENALLREALSIEAEVANQLLPSFSSEPTRSVVLCTAAIIALRLQLYQDAEKFASNALAGSPPTGQRTKLHAVLEDIRMAEALARDFVTIGERCAVLHLEGSGVGYGKVQFEDLSSRVESIHNLVVRSHERKLGKPYREKGKPPREVSEASRMFCEFEAASLKVNIRFGGSQSTLFGTSADDAIDLAAEVLDAVVRQDQDRYTQAVNDPDYQESLMNSVLGVMPDGRNVSSVSLVLASQNNKSVLTLNEPKATYKGFVRKMAKDLDVSGEVGTDVIVGEMLLMDASKHNGKFKIITTSGEVEVRATKVSLCEVLKPFFGQEVSIVVKKEPGGLLRFVEVWEESAPETV